MTTFSITTLGCKVNFYESEWIGERLVNAGLVRLEERESCPDWAIVNTCTVTGRADRQSRQVVYQTARRCPNTKIIITGCYADRDPEALRALPGVVGVTPNSAKASLPTKIVPDSPPTPPVMSLRSFGSHVRAYLMVQNGCNAQCAYCIIPKVRGRSRSKPIETVLREIETLTHSGHPEIVLCGIHLGLYGHDLTPRTSLGRLIEAIEAAPFEMKVRISSIEPMEFTEGLVRRVTDSEKICSHFHIPLQSGSGKILRRMRRPYTPQSFEALIQSIKKHLPRATIGTDVMVGFPGETNEDFKETCRFISSLPLSYLHVFPYSERPGTLSQSLDGKVVESVKKARVAYLLELGKKKREAFLSSWVGHTDTVIFEQRKGLRHWVGKSTHYLPVYVSSERNLLGAHLPVKIVSAESDFVWGEI